MTEVSVQSSISQINLTTH